MCLALHAQSLQSSPTLCNATDCSLPGSSVHGILQARILEWVAISSPGDLPNPGIKPVFPVSPALQADSLTTEQTGKPSAINREPWKVHEQHGTRVKC